jgi:hypothetical protein
VKIFLYGYENVYVRTHIKSGWRIPYFGPETRTEDEVKEFVKFAKIIMDDYPRSEITGRFEIKGEVWYVRPCVLNIFCNQRLQNVFSYASHRKIYREMIFVI